MIYMFIQCKDAKDNPIDANTPLLCSEFHANSTIYSHHSRLVWTHLYTEDMKLFIIISHYFCFLCVKVFSWLCNIMVKTAPKMNEFCGFGMTWGWVINDRIFIFGWIIPLSSYTLKNKGYLLASIGFSKNRYFFIPQKFLYSGKRFFRLLKCSSH